MPSPVEALPCGSRSTISTCSPIAASAVPRLIAVVVLPTPPFWLAIASTRGGFGLSIRLLQSMTFSAVAAGAVADGSDIAVVRVRTNRTLGRRLSRRSPPFQSADDHDTALAVGSAGGERMLNVPIFRGLGQFSVYILSFREQAEGTRRQEPKR